MQQGGKLFPSLFFLFWVNSVRSLAHAYEIGGSRFPTQ